MKTKVILPLVLAAILCCILQSCKKKEMSVCCNFQSTCDSIQIVNYNLEIEKSDKKILNELYQKYDKSIDTFILDKTKKMKILESYDKSINVLLVQKNESSFSDFKQILMYKSQKKKPCIPVIICLIILAGILGSIVRIFSDKLIDITKIEKNITAALAKTDVSSLKLNDGKSVSVENLKLAIMDEVKKNVSVDENKPLTYVVNFVYGILASSLSFLALKLFDSKILEFNSTNDYFIFWAFCILGTLFAKERIRSLFEKTNK